MSNYTDFNSQLVVATSLIQMKNYSGSLEVFSELLRMPSNYPLAAYTVAYTFLDLFPEQAHGFLHTGHPALMPVLRTSLTFMEQSQPEVAPLISSRIRTALQDQYDVVFAPEKPLQLILEEFRISSSPALGAFYEYTSADGRVYSLKNVEEAKGGGAESARPGDSIVINGSVIGGDLLLSRELAFEHTLRLRHKESDAGAERTALQANEQSVVRTPHMETSTNAPFVPGSRIDVRVWVDNEPSRPGEQAEDLVLPGGKDAYELQVFLLTSRGLRILDPGPLPLTIKRNDERSTNFEFQVVVESSRPINEASITAIFNHEGRPCGRVTRIFPAPPSAEDEDRNLLWIQPGARQPDLTVSITHVKGHDYECVVSTPHIPEYAKGVARLWFVEKTAPEIINGYVRIMTDEGISSLQRIAALRSAGMALFESSPELFREVFWRLVDEKKDAFTTILIVSDEKSYPWELMLPVRDNTPVQFPLGVMHRIGRWITSSHVAPPQSIRLKDAYVIAPRYIGEDALKSADDEIASLHQCFVASHCEPPVPIDPPDIDTLDKSLDIHATTLLHFICHGKTADNSDADLKEDQVIFMHNAMPFDAKLVRGLQGMAKAFKATHPLVFLNACEVGRQVKALKGTGGFAQAFITIGGAGIIAALWPVDDTRACEVATGFYDMLRDSGKICVAEFLREIRKRTFSGEMEDTYMAYCFYGDPQAEITIGGSPDHDAL